jgi:ABC-2 type transport system permease protein
MVRILIAMRAAALRNARQSRFGTVALIGGAIAGLATAVSTLLLGATTTAGRTGGADQLGLVMLSWMAGRIGFAAFSGGDPAIPLDLFRIIPAPRTELARALLLLGLADPAMPFLGIAFAAVVVYGFRLGWPAGVVAVLGAAGSLLLISFLSTIVAAKVPTGSPRTSGCCCPPRSSVSSSYSAP